MYSWRALKPTLIYVSYILRRLPDLPHTMNCAPFCVYNSCIMLMRLWCSFLAAYTLITRGQHGAHLGPTNFAVWISILIAIPRSTMTLLIHISLDLYCNIMISSSNSLTPVWRPFLCFSWWWLIAVLTKLKFPEIWIKLLMVLWNVFESATFHERPYLHYRCPMKFPRGFLVAVY